MGFHGKWKLDFRLSAVFHSCWPRFVANYPLFKLHIKKCDFMANGNLIFASASFCTPADPASSSRALSTGVSSLISQKFLCYGEIQDHC